MNEDSEESEEEKMDIQRELAKLDETEDEISDDEFMAQESSSSDGEPSPRQPLSTITELPLKESRVSFV